MQPRLLAAISFADQVVKERGDQLGKSIGYHVKFEARQPELDGSVTFCAAGVFLKQLQSSLASESGHGDKLYNVTHVIVNEVHGHEINTDLLQVVPKQLLAEKRVKSESLKSPPSI